MVEDDDGMREAIESLLDAAGFETAAYGSAEAFFADGAADRSLCVISDLKLPLTSGFELLTESRMRGPRPPVIMITAHDAPAERIEAERRGAAAFLAKPVAGGALLAAIESVAGTAQPNPLPGR